MIRYQTRSIAFKGGGGSLSTVQFSIGEFQTQFVRIHEASECAKILDDYQYSLCTMYEGLRKNDPHKKELLKLRTVTIGLLTALRVTLEAFKLDPEAQRNNLLNIVNEMQRFVVSIALANLRDYRVRAVKRSKRLTFEIRNDLQSRQIVPELRSEIVADALPIIGLSENELTSIVEEFS